MDLCYAYCFMCGVFYSVWQLSVLLHVALVCSSSLLCSGASVQWILLLTVRNCDREVYYSQVLEEVQVEAPYREVKTGYRQKERL